MNFVMFHSAALGFTEIFYSFCHRHDTFIYNLHLYNVHRDVYVVRCTCVLRPPQQKMKCHNNIRCLYINVSFAYFVLSRVYERNCMFALRYTVYSSVVSVNGFHSQDHIFRAHTT